MTNTYFDQLMKVAADYEAWEKDFESRRREIIDNDGWDTPDYQALQDEKENHPYPISSGACKAYRAWKYSTTDEVEMNDFLWENEVEQFLEALSLAGISSFIYTNQSTAVMENLHAFVDNGCKVGEFTKRESKDRWHDETILGIRIYL